MINYDSSNRHKKDKTRIEKKERKMKKAMISQPTGNLSKEEILENKDRAVKLLNYNGYKVINTYYNDFESNGIGVEKPIVWYLGKSIMAMADVEAVYFLKGWENARGCKIEHEVAKQYGIKIFHEE